MPQFMFSSNMNHMMLLNETNYPMWHWLKIYDAANHHWLDEVLQDIYISQCSWVVVVTGHWGILSMDMQLGSLSRKPCTLEDDEYIWDDSNFVVWGRAYEDEVEARRNKRNWQFMIYACHSLMCNAESLISCMNQPWSNIIFKTIRVKWVQVLDGGTTFC